MKLFFKQRKSNRKVTKPEVSNERKLSVKKESLYSFCTHSKYEGTWDTIGMRGYGSYYLFYGVDYDGDLQDSMFNERGTLLYPINAKVDGFWENGHMIAHRYFYSDNLCYGPYCAMPDRRFYLEIKEKLKPAGRSFLTNSFETRKIPQGCYDAGDGFYDPKMKCVYDPKDLKNVIRIPTKDQHDWIIKNCRKAWDEPVGFKPRLYENWRNLNVDQDGIQKMNKKVLMRRSVDFLSYRRNKSVSNL